MLGILYMQNGHNACIAQIKTFLFHALKQAKHPYALVSLHKQVISNSADITWICNLYPWNQVEPDMIEAEEEVMLDILADNNMLIDRKS